MIISASRRTDSPAFFPKETIEKIISINAEQNSQSTLFDKNNVDAVVFWTKNARPIMPYLNELDELKIPYYFQYTMNDYPKLEPGIPNYLNRVETFAELSETIGKNRVIWRYDPFFTCDVHAEYNIDDVLRRFVFMGHMVNKYTDKLVFSFLDMYDKMPLGIYPPTEPEREKIIAKVLEMNKMWKLKVATCAEDSYAGIEKNRCIDPVLLKSLGANIGVDKKDSSQRQKCGCYPSKDIGEYHSCKGHQCAYCYAK
jgi:hypothetical protein